MHTKEEKMAAFSRLLDVQDRLRLQCPWDKKQTFESLRPNTIEETFELCDALMKRDYKDSLSAAERYGYFIRKVSDFEEVWGLKDKEGWALMGNNEQVLFPVWSEKEFAELCKWDNYQPNSIPLDDFIEKLLPKLEKDNVMLAVFPLSKGKGIIRTVQEIIADIERECEQYE